MSACQTETDNLPSVGSVNDADIGKIVQQIAHMLPSQGPITVFVHHNTLHAYEHLPFSEAVIKAADDYDCHPYLREEDYRVALQSGRIAPIDLERELHEVLEENGDDLVGFLGTRHDLWMSMIEHPLHEGSEGEIRWFIEETDALYRFRREVPSSQSQESVFHIKQWLTDRAQSQSGDDCPIGSALSLLLDRFDGSQISEWAHEHATAFSLHLLWETCRYGSSLIAPATSNASCAIDTNSADDLVNDVLIRFTAAFLDQGFAHLGLPHRGRGFWQSFCDLYSNAAAPQPWLQDVARRLRDFEAEQTSPEQSIATSLRNLAVDIDSADSFLLEELLKLRGWAGMVWQMETNAEWTIHPAPPGTLVDFTAVRLVLLEAARRHIAKPAVKQALPPTPCRKLNRAFLVFQIAQVRGWSAVDLLQLTRREWGSLLAEIEAFDSRMRRRIYHQAYERHYRVEALKAIAKSSLESSRSQRTPQEPAYQVACCIDDREESFRRHLEEVAPDCETFGIAGFFGVAMYYRGASEAHFRPLCPVNIKPVHYITEEPAYSEVAASRRRSLARKAFGHTAHRVVRGSRSFVGGVLTGLLGSVATLPLVMRVLFPRLAARVSNSFGGIVADRHTQLRLESGDEESSQCRGYTVDEMTAIVGGFLDATGMTGRLSPLIIVFGHGSSSLNNPHAAAYDCGACGGGKGGPNARAFARMANDARVRARLATLGINISDETSFVGGYHNTCNDSVSYFDLDLLPPRRRSLLELAFADIEVARRRDAHERCRRFESASLAFSPEAALRHVEGRAEDLSQVRSECGHATNTICVVGRREWTRGLFLDRRAFLTSYDSTIDDSDCSILAKLLAAVIPVCAGINLEYYFSRVDNRGYGCGTKLPHNVTSMLGVMDGAGSDLRTGLPWQMVEIHEPMRILFVIETKPESMLAIMNENPTIDGLVRGEWVQLSLIDPNTGAIALFRNGKFECFEQSPADLPEAASSAAWYAGNRNHLGFAIVNSTNAIKAKRVSA